MNKDIFYIKTSDETDIAVFDLEFNDNEISYSYNAVEEDVASEPYETEVQEILSKLITEHMLEIMQKGK
jgi:hypothetical protein